jgi:hypothetical protein
MHRVHARWTEAGRVVHRGLTVARTEGTAALSPELGLCGARKLTGGGATERGERGELGGRLTEA